jgi:hypothetical protein
MLRKTFIALAATAAIGAAALVPTVASAKPMGGGMHHGGFGHGWGHGWRGGVILVGGGYDCIRYVRYGHRLVPVNICY